MFSSLMFWEWAMLILVWIVTLGAGFISGMIFMFIYD